MIPRSGGGGRNVNPGWADEVFAEHEGVDGINFLWAVGSEGHNEMTPRLGHSEIASGNTDSSYSSFDTRAGSTAATCREGRTAAALFTAIARNTATA